MIAHSHKDADAYYNRGLCKYDLGLYEKAKIDFDKSLEIDPTKSDCYHNRALCKYYLLEYKDAITDFNAAIDLN